MMIKALTLLIMFGFLTTGFCFAASSYRIIPADKVTVFDGTQKVGEFSTEGPLPMGKTLVCTKRCAIQMGVLRMVAEDGARFAVDDRSGNFILRVDAGTVYFALAQLPKPLAFLTPYGAYNAQQVVLTTSDKGGMLEGYLTISKKTNEIGVIHGGSMLVTTADSDKWIKEGNCLLLSQATVGAGSSMLGTIGAATAAGGFAAVGAVIAGTSSSDADPPKIPGSPSTP
jgi:hypothetical protein